VRATEALLASYLDLARHLDPLRYPDESPQEVGHRLGQFDPASMRAHLSALRSIANALEDLDDVDELDDEVDRTMLLDSIRSDTVRLDRMLASETSNPALPLRHLSRALLVLMGEDFDAECEAALRERIAAFPGFLESLREDTRPAPVLILERARIEAGRFADETLDMAAERLDDATVQPALVAIAEHRAWLDDDRREGGPYGFGEQHVEARLATLGSEPLGAKGTLRLLELRRAGVERSLAGAAEELGSSDPLACAQHLMDEAQPLPDIFDDFWADEWRRVGEAMREAGLPIPDAEPPAGPLDPADGWSMAAHAARDHAARMIWVAKAMNPRPVRRLLRGPGLLDGWGRTVAALLRNSEAFGSPERRAMMSFLALRDCAAAEADLLLHSRAASPDELMVRTQKIAGVRAEDARVIIGDIAADPLHALGAALAHEAWQGWYAEVGGEPVPFVLKAMLGGGLAVPLARWALETGDTRDERQAT
jgi:hypothetical protein